MCHALEKIATESPCSIPLKSSPTSKTSSSESSTSSTHNTCSTASTYILRPRFPITYNEGALIHLHRRPQVKTLNNMSIPLPISSEEESPTSSNSDEQEPPTAEAVADSPTAWSYFQQAAQIPDSPHRPREESPTYQMPHSPPQPWRGVTSAKDARLPATVEESPALPMPTSK